MNFIDRIHESPVIGAISTADPIQPLIESPCDVFFILNGNISDLKATTESLMSQKQLVFVHVDLISGLKGDMEGLRFIKDYIRPTGIITTKSSLIKEAKALKLHVIQRLFLLDSKNLESGVQSVLKHKPDAVEILPGAMHKITQQIVNRTGIPVITGGLIQDKDDIIQSLKCGVVGVSTSNRKLWSI